MGIVLIAEDGKTDIRLPKHPVNNSYLALKSHFLRRVKFVLLSGKFLVYMKSDCKNSKNSNTRGNDKNYNNN